MSAEMLPYALPDIDQTAAPTDYYKASRPTVVPFIGRHRTASLEPRHVPEGVQVIKDHVVTLGNIAAPRVQYIGVYDGGDGIRQEVLVTEPEPRWDTGDNPVIVSLPGCSEYPKVGSARTRHDGMSYRHPDHLVVSIASDGLNQHGSRLSLQEAEDRDFPDMGKARLETTEAYAGGIDGRRVKGLGESMGTVILTHMALANLDDPRVEFDGLVMNDDALMEPEHSKLAMLGRFPAHVVLDYLKEAAFHPIQTAESTGVRTDLLHPSSWVALYGQVRHLLPGTVYEFLDEVAGEERIGIVKGKHDALLDSGMLSRLEQEHRDTVIVERTNGGHMQSLNYKASVRRISHMFDKLAALQP